MAVTLRNYESGALFNKDYYALRDFFIKFDNHSYHFGNWDWLITHNEFDKNSLSSIGIWENNGEIVAAASYFGNSGKPFFLMHENYRYLGEEMFSYLKGSFAHDREFGVYILDGDIEMQNIAVKNGFHPTQDKECEAIYPIETDKIHYTLPEGFTITSMADTYDLYKYGKVLWKGFNHEANGEGPFIFRKEELPQWECIFKRPNCNLDLKIAVVAPNGDFVSYCGMWYDAASKNALVEPVATDPDYRKMGLGRAAVLEAIRRCGMLGAEFAHVVSSQQFYYNIGFRPYATSTWWVQI